MAQSRKKKKGSAANLSFATLKDSVSSETMQVIDYMGFKTMTEIQAKCIPHLLAGKNLRGTAKTGSGKTLSFLIPTVERVAKLDLKPSDGTAAIIISPTRELCIQIYGVLQNILSFHKLTSGLAMGKNDVQTEMRSFLKGVNILVATPGRLLEHLENSSFKFDKLGCLVIDEADRICDDGFAWEMTKIIQILPEQRQTMFFSATLNDRTMELSRLALPSNVVHINAYDEKIQCNIKELVHRYLNCPLEKKVSLLGHKLRIQHKKIMVFFATCSQVEFFEALFKKMNFFSIEGFHGKKSQNIRSLLFSKFNEGEFNVLLCTNAAARGWDIPNVDLIIQFDPPSCPNEYIHRIGRTARAGQHGKALVFLTESQKEFLDMVNSQNLKISEEMVGWKNVKDITPTVKTLVNSNQRLLRLAQSAYETVCNANTSLPKSGTFSILLDTGPEVARTYGLWRPSDIPKICVASKNESKVKRSMSIDDPNVKKKKRRKLKLL